jgi:hypothetical protein
VLLATNHDLTRVLHVAESVDYWAVSVLGKLVDGVSFEDPGD